VTATEALLKMIKYPEDKARCHALNALVYTGEDGHEVRNTVADLYPEKQYTYSSRIVQWL